MQFPVPNQKEVDAFRDLYKRRFGVELNPEEGFELARKVVGLVYIQRHTLFPVRQEK